MRVIGLCAIALFALLPITGCQVLHDKWIGAPNRAPWAPSPLSNPELAQLENSVEFQRGVADAESQIQSGNLMFKTYGLIVRTRAPSIYERRYEQALARYGVHFQNQGCEIPSDEEVKGYIHRMASEILVKYGAQFWVRMDLEARTGGH